MSTYFSVDADFWTDADVMDNFTPEDKYFYLYLLTSPHCNVSGCFELSIKQASYELGYSKDTVDHLVERFITVHKMIDYDRDTKEMLVHKWGKHHWTHSDKYIVALRKKVSEIKSAKFKAYLLDISERFIAKEDTVWIPYQYGMDTTFLSFPLNNTIPLSIEDSNRGVGEEEETKKTASKKDKVKKVGVFEEFANGNQELLEVLKDFDKMRNEMKKPMSDRAKSLFVNKLKKEFPKEQWIAVVEQSILRGWDTVWPLRDGGNDYGTGKNKRGGYGKNSRESQGKDFSDIRPSLDPDDESTWGT